jgi:trans-2-enoyl-CoA reductase
MEDEIIEISFKLEDELSEMSLKEIQDEINVIEQFSEELHKKKIELSQEIELFEEDWTLYEEEELQVVKQSLKKVTNYLDKLYDFESFAK